LPRPCILVKGIRIAQRALCLRRGCVQHFGHYRDEYLGVDQAGADHDKGDLAGLGFMGIASRDAQIPI